MVKRILLILIICSFFNLPIYAESTLITINPTFDATTGVVNVNVDMSDNPGIAAFDLTMQFDNMTLSPISLENGVVDNIVSNIQSEYNSNVDFVTAVRAKSTDFKTNGTLFTIKFKPIDNTQQSIKFELKGTLCNQKQESIILNDVISIIDINKDTNNYYTSSKGGSSSRLSQAEKSLNDTLISKSNVNFQDISDVPWAMEAITSLASNGIINGTSETTFSPSENITRADFIALLVRKLGLNTSFSENFEDVTQEAYYYNEVGVARSLGIAMGVGENCFNPNGYITRQDMFVLTYRALVHLNMIKSTEENVLKQFKDNELIDYYAYEAIAVLSEEKLIVGNDGYLNPMKKSTRAETAVMIYRLPEHKINEVIIF